MFSKVILFVVVVVSLVNGGQVEEEGRCVNMNLGTNSSLISI